jgi:hypothetical protein
MPDFCRFRLRRQTKLFVLREESKGGEGFSKNKKARAEARALKLCSSDVSRHIFNVSGLTSAVKQADYTL